MKFPPPTTTANCTPSFATSAISAGLRSQRKKVRFASPVVDAHSRKPTPLTQQLITNFSRWWRRGIDKV